MTPIGSRFRRPLLAGLTIAAFVVTAGCNAITGIRGQGAMTSETRQVAAFTAIEATFGIGVTATIGPVQSIEVRAQANLLPIIETKVSNGTLTIRATEELFSTEHIEVVVVTPGLEAIALRGGSRGQVNGVSTPDLDVDLGGGSVLVALGSADRVSLHADGGSRAELAGLSARRVDIDVSGGSVADVLASEEVTGSASGGAHATVHGGARLNVSADGGGVISRG